MDIKTSTMSFHVGYICKYCELIFKSTDEFCTHKVNFHFTKLTKSRCIVFEESTVEPTETQLTNFRKAVTIVQVQPQFNNKFEDKLCVGEKQEPSEPVFISETVETSTNLKIDNRVSLLALSYSDPKPGNISDIKTEWMEETLIKYETSHQNKDFITIHANSVTDPQENDYDNKTETESNFIGHDADGDVGLQLLNIYQNPPELSDVTQSTESMSSSFTADTEQEYLSKNQSDSDDDIICLDDDPLPSTTNKIPSPTGPTTTTTTTAGLNNSVFSQLALKCEICSKQFSSRSQLGIHVGICKLYNSGKAVASTGPGPGPASVVRGREKPEVRKDILMVQCQECFKLIKSHNFKKHTKYHQLRARREFVCQICGSAFGSKANLDNHGGVHSDEIRYKCTFPGCQSAFKYKSGLHKHSKRHASSKKPGA